MFNMKDLRITFQLGVGSFNGGGNTKIISGAACSFNIENVALPDFCKCSGKIYGMNSADIASLTTLAFDPLVIDKRNLIKVEAGSGGNYSTVFYGELESSFGDFSSAPNIALQVSGYTGSYAMKLAAPATSFKDSLSVKDIISKLATKCGYTLECSLTDKISNGVFQGSVMQQIYSVARSVGAKVVIDADILRVMKISESLPGKAVLLSKTSGLIGYPTFTNMGISLACEFNPLIKQQCLIEVDSIVPKAKGTWRVIKLAHSLSANMPSGGDWKSSVEAVYA